MSRRQLVARRTVADDDFRPRMAALQECLDILLNRDPPDIKLQRARQMQQAGMRADTVVEMRQIDAAPPMPHLMQPVFDQRRADRRCGREDRLRGPVEPLDIAPNPFGGHPRARRHIIRELRVIGGGERQFAPQTPAPCRNAKRPFGGQMNGIGREHRQHVAHPPAPRQRQPDFGIGRTRHRSKQVGGDHQHLMPLPLQHRAHGLQRADHAVDLRCPGIGDDGDFHGRTSPVRSSRAQSRGFAERSRGSALTSSRFARKCPSTTLGTNGGG